MFQERVKVPFVQRTRESKKNAADVIFDVFVFFKKIPTRPFFFFEKPLTFKFFEGDVETEILTDGAKTNEGIGDTKKKIK